MKRLSIFIALYCFLVNISISQSPDYYVVIGAFKNEENAKAYVTRAQDLNIPAIYALHNESRTFYVYVRRSQDKNSVVATKASMREEGFQQTWIYQGKLDNRTAISSVTTLASNSQKQVPTLVAQEPQPIESTPADLPTEETSVTNTAPEQGPGIENTSLPDEHKVATPPTGKAFVFQLKNQKSKGIVHGTVRLLESERAAEYRAYIGNEKVYVDPPANRSGKWIVVCQLVGYKVARKQVSYKVENKDNAEITVPIELVPVTKNDYVELEHVRFFDNSNALKPESTEELGELLAMMNDNPSYHIRIHGHTNGNHSREIRTVEQGADYFSEPSASEAREASAKELSSLRADIIKWFLLSNGVEEKRVDTRGESGKQPIFETKSKVSNGNDRVEVEITRN